MVAEQWFVRENEEKLLNRDTLFLNYLLLNKLLFAISSWKMEYNRWFENPKIFYKYWVRHLIRYT